MHRSPHHDVQERPWSGTCRRRSMLEFIPGSASEKVHHGCCPLPDRAMRNWTLDGSGAIGVASSSTPVGGLFLNRRKDESGNRKFRSLMEERDRKEMALTQAASRRDSRGGFFMRRRHPGQQVLSGTESELRVLFFGNVVVEPACQLILRSRAAVHDQSITQLEWFFGGELYGRSSGEDWVLHATGFSQDPLLGEVGE